MSLALVMVVILAATAAGYAAGRRSGAAGQDAASRLLSVMLFVVMPPIVFFNVAHLELSAAVGTGVALAWIALLATTGIAWWLNRRRDRVVTGTVMLGAVQANTGYLGYPLTAVLFGAHRLPEAVAYDVAVSAPLLFTFGFGIGANFGRRGGTSVRERARAFVFRNPLLPAFILGLAAPSSLAPDALVDLSRALVFAMLPAGFFAVGVFLAVSLPQGVRVPPLSREVALGVILRVAVAPALLWLMAVSLIDLPKPYLLLAAMPCGINVLLVANAYELDRGLAAAMIAWSTAVVLAGVLVAAALGLA